MREIWSLKGRVRSYDGGWGSGLYLEEGRVRVYGNRFPHHLQYEFMDFFLFPEEYTIQVYRQDIEFDRNILDTLEQTLSPPAEGRGSVKWVMTYDGNPREFVIGSGKVNLKHSILANFVANSNLSPREKLDRVLQRVYSGLTATRGSLRPNSLGDNRVWVAGQFEKRPSKSQFLPKKPVLSIDNDTGHYAVDAEMLMSSKLSANRSHSNFEFIAKVATDLKRQSGAGRIKFEPRHFCQPGRPTFLL